MLRHGWEIRRRRARGTGRLGLLGVLTHWHTTGHSRQTVGQPHGVMHRSRSLGISWTITPCLHSVNMKRLIEMTKGALQGPFPM